MTATAWHTQRRRGTAYAFFLMTAMLVAIIGMSGLTVAGLGLRSVVAVNDRIAAQTYAEAGVDIGLVALYRTASWRDVVPVDTWSTPMAIGDGTLEFKIAPLDGLTFTGKRNGRVRIYGRGIRGNATWLYSEVVQPPLEEPLTTELSNGDLESGVASPWFQTGGCVVMHATWEQYAGTASLLVTGRSPGSAAAQSIPGLSNGTTVQAEVQVKVNGGSDNAWLRLEVLTTEGTQQFEIASGTISNWQRLSGSITPNWTGNLIQADFVVGSDGTSELFIDDARVMLTPGPPGPVPGTWQRETN